MNTEVQITLIVCATIIIVYFMSLFKKDTRDTAINERYVYDFGTNPRPTMPGNKDNSRLNEIFKRE